MSAKGARRMKVRELLEELHYLDLDAEVVIESGGIYVKAKKLDSEMMFALYDKHDNIKGYKPSKGHDDYPDRIYVLR